MTKEEWQKLGLCSSCSDKFEKADKDFSQIGLGESKNLICPACSERMIQGYNKKCLIEDEYDR